MLTLRKDYCTLVLLLQKEKSEKGIGPYYIFIDHTDSILLYYTCFLGTENNNNESCSYILMKSKSNHYPTSQREATFIDILADSAWTQHRGNFAIFGGF